MKTVEAIIEKLEGNLADLDFALNESREETALKYKRMGARSALQELLRFIRDEKRDRHE